MTLTPEERAAAIETINEALEAKVPGCKISVHITEPQPLVQADTGELIEFPDRVVISVSPSWRVGVDVATALATDLHALTAYTEVIVLDKLANDLRDLADQIDRGSR